MVLYILIIFFIISPFFPAARNPHWFFRTADFVRLQSLVIQLVLLGLFLYLEENYTLFSWILLATLIASIVYQIFKVFPYSSLFPRGKSQAASDQHLSIFAGNVLQSNTRYSEFIKEVKRFDPDLILAMETNKDWENGLSELEDEYPYTVKVPLENFYGMHVYSKRILRNVEVKYQIEDDKPSIFFDFYTDENSHIHFCCLHPAPPSPT